MAQEVTKLTPRSSTLPCSESMRARQNLSTSLVQSLIFIDEETGPEKGKGLFRCHRKLLAEPRSELGLFLSLTRFPRWHTALFHKPSTAMQGAALPW